MSEKQGPPHHLPATDIRGEKGYIELDTTYIGKQPTPGKNPKGGGFSVPPTRAGGMGSGITNNEGLRRQTRDNIKAAEALIKNEYAAKSQELPNLTEVDIANMRAQFSVPASTPSQAYQHELNIRNLVIQHKTAELHAQTLLANTFYGHSPLNATIGDYLARAQALDKTVTPRGPAYSTWVTSYKAAYSAQLLTAQIQLLNNQQVHVQQLFSAAQAQEQRAAAEHARMAAEQARLEAEAEVQRQAEQLRLENQRQAEEGEALRKAMEAAQGARPFSVSGAAAASGPVFTVAAGTLAFDAATSLAIKTALRSATATAITALAAAVGTASGAVIVVGVATLVYYALQRNKEPYTLSVPLSGFTTYDADELHAIAEANGEIELPVVLGSKTTESTTEFVVATANNAAVPGKVPVRIATYDPLLNHYSAHHPGTPGIGMTWTPIVRLGNSSTALPVHEQNVVSYDGAILTALEGRIDTSPALDVYSFGGFIYVFPIESGIPPQYVVLSTPYDGATTIGKFSGRKFNPERSGGPILELDWRTATVTREGVDLVRLHTARLDQSDANDIMIKRLENILKGELALTDTDRRYYTHEIRELERFRLMGLSDVFMPEEGSQEWNNAHTATLEDFKLGASESLLYSADALEAGNKQIERIYENLLKGGFQ